MGSLVCHQRVGDEPVPGCTSSVSFEPLPVIPLDDVGNNMGADAYGHCQGDCDSGEFGECKHEIIGGGCFFSLVLYDAFNKMLRLPFRFTLKNA